MRPSRNETTAPCNCVFRAIFRICYRRFLNCSCKEKHISRVSMENFGAGVPGQRVSKTWGLKNEEYITDFCLVAKRSLTDDSYVIFRQHFILGMDWKGCCAKFQIERGAFFHQVYRIQQKLGRAFREVEPYGLFPVDEYFASSGLSVKRKAIEPKEFKPRKAHRRFVRMSLQAA